MSAEGEDSEDSSTSSSGEDEVALGLQGYQFEPKRSGMDDNSSEERSSSGDSDDDPVPDPGGRMGNTAWCRCGRCSEVWLSREKECVCCQEKPASRALAAPTNTDNTICIANNGDFTTLCLTPVVLRNVLVALNNIRGDHWDVNPPNNRDLRYAAYRQYTWWVHGRLGPKRRRVIPSCVTHSVRATFPKEPDEQYEGFHSGEEDSD